MKSKTMKSIAVFTGAIILLAVGPALCGGVKQPVNRIDTAYTNPQETIQGNAGREFSIVLDANPTTGYQWRLTHPTDEKTLKLVDKKYKAPNTNLAGAGGHEIWSFKALSVGQEKLIFEYVRPWEKDKSPVKSISFTINIR
jgi:inhibitor of cysteine peptidase